MDEHNERGRNYVAAYRPRRYLRGSAGRAASSSTIFDRLGEAGGRKTPTPSPICSIEDKRARDRAKEAGLGRGAKRKAEGHLIEGQTTTSWKQALGQLALVYPDRIHPYL